MKPQDRTRAVLRSGLKSGEKLVLVAVCDYCNTHGESFPSVTTLAADCGMGRSTVLRHLTNLEGRGLAKTVRIGRSTLYRFDPGSLPTRPKSGPVSNRDPSQIGTPVVPNRDSHPSQIETPPVPNRDPKRILKRPSEATSEAGELSTHAGRAASPAKSAKGIWVEEAQARGWMVVVPSRAEIEKLAPVWKGAGPERFRAVVGAYMDAVQAGEHWQRESTPQVGPFIKGAQEALSGSVGESEEVRAVVAELQRCESWYWHGRNWGEVAEKLGAIADAVGRAMVEATGAEEPWSAYGQVKGMDDWKMDRFKKKAAAAARRMG